MTTSSADANRVIVIGENPFIRLSETDGGPPTTDASFWWVILSPGGPGHVLFIKSELTDNEVRVYSDNISMARWLQETVQGMLNPAFGDKDILVAEAGFERSGDPRSFWTETVFGHDEDLSLTWYDIGEPLLIHTQPNSAPDRPYGVSTILVPAAGARLTVNGVQAAGRPWPREREGRPFSTCALAFNESWTQAR